MDTLPLEIIVAIFHKCNVKSQVLFGACSKTNYAIYSDKRNCILGFEIHKNVRRKYGRIVPNMIVILDNYVKDPKTPANIFEWSLNTSLSEKFGFSSIYTNDYIYWYILSNLMTCSKHDMIRIFVRIGEEKGGGFGIVKRYGNNAYFRTWFDDGFIDSAKVIIDTLYEEGYHGSLKALSKKQFSTVSSTRISKYISSVMEKCKGE